VIFFGELYHVTIKLNVAVVNQAKRRTIVCDSAIATQPDDVAVGTQLPGDTILRSLVLGRMPA
jgi:hypothetical protein